MNVQDGFKKCTLNIHWCIVFFIFVFKIILHQKSYSKNLYLRLITTKMFKNVLTIHRTYTYVHV